VGDSAESEGKHTITTLAAATASGTKAAVTVPPPADAPAALATAATVLSDLGSDDLRQ
jgi:hypothetical protein